MTTRIVAAVLIAGAALLLMTAYPLLKIRWGPAGLPKTGGFAGPPAAADLRRHVEALSGRIGPRSVADYEALEEARRYIAGELSQQGHLPSFQEFLYQGKRFANVIVTIPGRDQEEILVGAHYDTVAGTPGADDNASGVAVLLELARSFRHAEPRRTLKLVFFTLEEPPLFGGPFMGSAFYARQALSRGERIRAMLSLEMLGYFHDRKGGQAFPLPFMGLFYPSTPDFIAVVGNLASHRLVAQAARSLRKGCDVPVETLAAPALVPGVDLSDHSPFWGIGVKAVMITDTAFYRNPHYHTAKDTMETLDFNRMAALLPGIVRAVEDLCNP